MTETSQTPTEEIHLPVPQESEEQISKEEINKQIKHYWAEIDITRTFTEYKEAFDKLNYYRDLKLKLYK